MKMNKKRPILRRAAIPAVLALLCTLFWFGKPNDFGLGRNMELLVNMMRELSLFYVDEVDPDQLMQDAAEGMTRNLDPYTEFLPEEQMSNFDLLTTGKYGGIRNSLIRLRDDGAAIIVVSEEIDELFEISDRIAVMYRGALSPAVPKTTISIEEVGRWMSGLWPDSPFTQKTSEAH